MWIINFIVGSPKSQLSHLLVSAKRFVGLVVESLNVLTIFIDSLTVFLAVWQFS